MTYNNPFFPAELLVFVAEIVFEYLPLGEEYKGLGGDLPAAPGMDAEALQFVHQHRVHLQHVHHVLLLPHPGGAPHQHGQAKPQHIMQTFVL